MNLYSWKSKYLAKFCLGEIVVMANNISEARGKVLSKFLDTEDDLDTFRQEILDDIYAEPMEILCGDEAVLFIRGGL